METTSSRGNDTAGRSIVGSCQPCRRPSLEKKEPRPSLEKKAPAAGKRQLAGEGKEQPAGEEASGEPTTECGPAPLGLASRDKQADVSGCTAVGVPARKSAPRRELAPWSSRATPEPASRAGGQRIASFRLVQLYRLGLYYLCRFVLSFYVFYFRLLVQLFVLYSDSYPTK